MITTSCLAVGSAEVRSMSFAQIAGHSGVGAAPYCQTDHNVNGCPNFRLLTIYVTSDKKVNLCTLLMINVTLE